MEGLSRSAGRVARALAELGIQADVRELPGSTRTAGEAAAAVGCPVERIVKSIVLRAEESDRPVLVMVGGDRRVDIAAVEEIVGEPVSRADPTFVRERTGFAIGGVPPVGHEEPPAVVCDSELLAHPEVWAAAGTPRAVFPISPSALVRAARARVADVGTRPS